MWYLERLGKLVAHPALLLLARGTLSTWEVPSWHGAMLAWGMGRFTQNEAVFLLLCGYSQGFLPLCC